MKNPVRSRIMKWGRHRLAADATTADLMIGVGSAPGKLRTR